MNLYIRYFDNEVVVTNVEDALDFIRGIEGFVVTPQFEKEFRDYAEGSMPYPKRYKVRARLYFIVIKTTAATLEEFKANGKHAAEEEPLAEQDGDAPRKPLRQKDQILMRLHEERPGWYEGTMKFKRVVFVPETGKYDYIDSNFTSRVKAMSGQDCYERMVDYLQSRPDIDPRCQFPSSKGKNYSFEFLGIKPLQEMLV